MLTLPKCVSVREIRAGEHCDGIETEKWDQKVEYLELVAGFSCLGYLRLEEVFRIKSEYDSFLVQRRFG